MSIDLDAWIDDALGLDTPGGVGADISLTDFKRRTWRGYVHTPYQQRIDDTLTQVARYVETGGAEGIGRAMFFLPPRHGKTETVSRRFPAWILGQMPDVRLIAASYGATLAYRNSRYVRNLINSPQYQQIYPHIHLSSDSAAMDQWDIDGHNGGLIAAGVGGGITGHGANIGIIDDPIKSRAEAESETYRERSRDWFYNDFLTRIEEPGGAIIVMLTRWHMHDLAGVLLEDGTDQWHILELPAIAGDDDPLGRQPGEALWPERYGVDVLNKRRAQMGEYAFAALYQQQPIPSGGGLFDTGKIEVIHELPPEHRITKVARFYDLAVTAKKHSDYTVGLQMGLTDDERYVVMDVWRVQKAMPEVQEGIAQNAQVDGKKTHIRLEAEKAGIIQLDYLLRDARMRPFALDAKPPEGDKYTRATAPASRVNAGRVQILRAGWNHAFLDELAVFPMGAHDDQVDAFSGAYDMLAQGQPSVERAPARNLYRTPPRNKRRGPRS